MLYSAQGATEQKAPDDVFSKHHLLVTAVLLFQVRTAVIYVPLNVLLNVPLDVQYNLRSYVLLTNPAHVAVPLTFT